MEWLVLRCPSNRTLALAAALAEQGAWTPTWRRRKRFPRSNATRLTSQPCIPGMVFVPEHGQLPKVRIDYSLMKNWDHSYVRIPDSQLAHLRHIADKPLIPASKLPRPGERLRFNEGPFQGLYAKVLACSIRYATVVVEGFAQPLQVPPCILRAA